MTIRKYYDAAEAEEALKLTSDINVDLYRQIGLVSYWNNKLAAAEMQFDRISNAVEKVQAGLYKEIRALAIAGGSKITEGQVQNEIECNPKYQQVKMWLVEAKYEVAQLKGMSYALKQRMDVLTTVSRNLISEMRDATVPGHIKEDRREKLADILTRAKTFEEDNT